MNIWKGHLENDSELFPKPTALKNPFTNIRFYRNELYNNAYAALLDYRYEDNDIWSQWPLMMHNFGENNELYHSYGP